MAKTIVILMGLQASGKTTFYQTYLSQKLVHVNLDTLKSRKRESEVIAECFKKQISFAVDNTNPSREDRARYITLAKKEGYFVIGCFFSSKIKDCIQRNALREGKKRVPELAIASTCNTPGITGLLGKCP